MIKMARNNKISKHNNNNIQNKSSKMRHNNNKNFYSNSKKYKNQYICNYRKKIIV